MSAPQSPFGPVYRVGDRPMLLRAEDAMRLLSDVSGIEAILDVADAVETHRRDRARLGHFVASLVAVVAFFGFVILLLERAA